METWSSYREAESTLLTLRRTQRGAPTLGDEADRTLLLELAALPRAAETLARASGSRLGSDVYAWRYHEDSLTQGLAFLAEGLHRSGLGELRMEDAFHRTARVHYAPPPQLSPADPQVRSAFIEGLISGYLSQTYNCSASARALDCDILEIILGEGRDINHKERKAA